MAKTEPRKYQVLRRTGGFESWDEVGVFDAMTAERAQKDAAQTSGVEGTYVAVPVRSWNPQPYVSETPPARMIAQTVSSTPKPERPLGVRETAGVAA